MPFDLRSLTACALLCLIAVPAANAASDNQPAPRMMTMPGQGVAKAAPDQAQFSTGVVTQERTAALALAANSRAMNAVFATLKRLGIPDKDIQTSNFSLSPQYQVCKPGTACPQRIAGYEVSNTVNVTVEDFGKTGAVLDALVASGSNRIDDISFSIRDTSALLKQAREAAVKDAILRAQTYAKAAGVTLGPILSIDEGGSNQPRPLYKAMAMMAGAAPPPVAGGEESVTADVSMTWEIK
ncbi:MAG: SIMPL domain-containing protein [Alphaproteobacteria bacterium]|nr:SIMPL domain-containing protein [Alphaproteobacteria bacterium]MDE2631329.1 SIMPL domain-containing protein [Alphaproteobacteria bacterium]